MSDNHDGWIGPNSQMLFYLDIVCADKDAEGRYIISGAAPTSFMGDLNNDVVIPGDAVYFTQGKPCNLAAGLRSTSYGMAVKVY